ncbi:hypothetical protein ACHWQZ_G018566 [Mnemiopsis leidyi]
MFADRVIHLDGSLKEDQGSGCSPQGSHYCFKNDKGAPRHHAMGPPRINEDLVLKRHGRWLFLVRYDITEKKLRHQCKGRR